MTSATHVHRPVAAGRVLRAVRHVHRAGAAHPARLRRRVSSSPTASVPDVLDAVAGGEVDAGFVPIENSIEGMVNFTLDALAFDHDLIITREVVLDIEHCLVARPGTSLADVKESCRSRSRPPSATASCASTCRARSCAHRDSTASAAQTRQRRRRPPASPRSHRGSAAELYGLDVIADDIADHDGNQTRFVAVARDGIPPPHRPRPHGARRLPARRRAGQPDLDPAGVRRPPASTCRT